MKTFKALGLASVAAMATFAFAIAPSALATDEVVLCKKLVEAGKLCPKGELWPAGSIVLALAENIKFQAEFNVAECEDSLFKAELGAMGSTLPLKIISWESGVLPKPELGEGCEGCVEGVHTISPEPSSIEVAKNDDFFFKTNAEFHLLGCSGQGFDCQYSSEEIKGLIDHKGKHPLHKAEDLPRIAIQVSLTLRAGIFCPKEVTWDPVYVIYAVHAEGKTGLGWPALDLK